MDKSLTTKEYTQKLAELRKQRDYYSNLATENERISRTYAKQMDDLQGDYKILNLLKNSYIKVVDPGNNSYANYFHINSWENDTRGAILIGIGYTIRAINDSYQIVTFTTHRICWDQIDKHHIFEITEDEFLNAYERTIAQIRKQLIYKPNSKNEFSPVSDINEEVVENTILSH